MLRYFRLMMWSAGLAIAGGCSDQPAPAPAQPAPPVTSAESSPTAAVSVTPLASETDVKDKQSAVVAPPVPVAEPADARPTEATPTEPAQVEDRPEPAEVPAPERIAIFTPGGPLLVDVRMTIGGKPIAAAFDSLVKRVMDAGDSDHDGQSTWKELAADRGYLEKEMPNAPAANSRQMKTLIERYDENRDGKIQTAEAAAWLGRDAGASAKPLTIRSRRAYRPVPRATSQVWHLVDGDGDGRLTNEEISAAPQHLLALDADDDRILAPTEMASLREQLEAAGQQRMYVGRDSNHYAVIHLDSDLDVERLNYLLSDLYAPRQDLGPASFSQLSEAYAKLDVNGDGLFDAEELVSIRSTQPHMQLDVAFSEAADDKPGAATIDAKTLTSEVAVAEKPAADRTIVALGNSRLIFSAHSLAARTGPGPSYGQAAARNQIHLMVHDEVDAIFEELDANADGRLGEREIGFCSQRFAERDRNGDGQLSGDEFPYSMIVAFLLGEQAADRSFYVPPSPAVATIKSEKPVPSWFTSADLNGDGDVSRREFLGSTEQFDRLDDDKDGYVGPTEAGE